MVDIEHQHNYKRVLESVSYKGILYPLIVVDMSIEAWEYDKAHNNPDINDPPDHLKRCLRIQCGNNRYCAGLELGVKEFDCLVFKSVREATEACVAQRKGDKSW